MAAFFVTAAALLLAALAFVLAPLARNPAGAAGAGGKHWPYWRSALPVALTPPLLAALLYAALGNPAALLPGQQLVEEAAPPQVEAMVARLAARLKDNPRDAEGWRMLARSYETLRRFDQAAEAYRQLLTAEGESADLLTDYAVVLGMANGQRLSGEPQKILERALALDPQHMQALALLGSAALERSEYESALRHWKKILNLAPSGSGIAQSIEQSIRRVEAQIAAEQRK